MDSEFDNIRPYTDEEAVEAFHRIAKNPVLPLVSKYLFPKQSVNVLSKKLLSVNSIGEFQDTVMIDTIAAILAKTSEGFTCSGIENIEGLEGKKFLAVSNHRDIVLDPALIQYAMFDNGFPYTRICVGNNLLSSQWIEDLMRSNRMITVIRGISSRELYLSSQKLSKYIRKSITEGEASVWIAQREGRTKNGLDTTEQGLLKMFDMSGEKEFDKNFAELNIVPMSISYEYEPCDSRKAREVLMREIDGTYKKKPNEDLHSIMTGISQVKGHIHLSIGKPLSKEEIESASALRGNDRYQAIRSCLNERIRSGYKLFKTNYIAYDLLNGTTDFLGVKYLAEEAESFANYVDHKLSKVERRLDTDALRKVFLGIYANPVKTRE